MKTIGIFVWTLALSFFLPLHGHGADSSGSTQTVSGGGVTARATYLNPKSSDEPRFQIALDTHSVNLDGYDLKAAAVLRDDTGKTYAPASVESKGSGHHREAIVAFPKVDRGVKKIELLLNDLAGVKERRFAWDAN